VRLCAYARVSLCVCVSVCVLQADGSRNGDINGVYTVTHRICFALPVYLKEDEGVGGGLPKMSIWWCKQEYVGAVESREGHKKVDLSLVCTCAVCKCARVCVCLFLTKMTICL